MCWPGRPCTKTARTWWQRYTGSGESTERTRVYPFRSPKNFYVYVYIKEKTPDVLDRIIYTITHILYCIYVNPPEYTRRISHFFFSLNHTRVYSTHRKVSVFAIDGRNEAYDEWRAHSHPPPLKTNVLHWKSWTMSQATTTTVQSAVCLAWQSEFEYVVLYVLGINVISCTEAIKVESMEFKYLFCLIYVASFHRFQTHTHPHSTTHDCAAAPPTALLVQTGRAAATQCWPDESKNKQQTNRSIHWTCIRLKWCMQWLSLE